MIFLAAVYFSPCNIINMKTVDNGYTTYCHIEYNGGDAWTGQYSVNVDVDCKYVIDAIRNQK